VNWELVKLDLRLCVLVPVWKVCIAEEPVDKDESRSSKVEFRPERNEQVGVGLLFMFDGTVKESVVANTTISPYDAL
jgi:hypothetical protein